MRTALRVVAAAMAAVVLAGPLAAVHAQQQQPAPPPARPAPEVFKETLKAQEDAQREQELYDAGAVAVNAFLIPGRAVTCVLGSATSIGVLALTLGTGYRAASAVFREGCGGKWVVSGEDLRDEVPTSRPFDWEQR
ncbi:MAG TPA: hypothetical protein VNN07_01875 [Candidatus Tectomicrobia bacterium]|nr:hypothetical protein [Candidatus Tectomicrobia bacterium]